MPRFWGFHQMAIPDSYLRYYQGKTFPFPTPIEPRMRTGDYVYLFWSDETLYGWGMIERMRPRDDAHNDVTVRLAVSQPPIARVSEEIKTNPIFSNYDHIKQEGCISVFSDDQLRYLNMLIRRAGAETPPDPDEVREQAASEIPLRPFQAEFIRGQSIPVDETRFVEYKEIVVSDPLPPILKRVDEYVIAFLNLEDRRYEDYCRLLFGVRDSGRVVVGVPLTGGQRDEISLRVTGKLKKLKPPIARSSFYIEFRQVKDESGSPIADLYIVEVGVGRGETGFFYCSENDSFYLRLDAENDQLKGQELIAEIKHRVKSGKL